MLQPACLVTRSLNNTGKKDVITDRVVTAEQGMQTRQTVVLINAELVIYALDKAC